jgi:hypothetical protein
MRSCIHKGARLYKRMTVKVFPPAGGRTRTIILRAPQGKWFSGEAVDKQLEEIGNSIEKAYPGHEFRVVSLGPTAVKIVVAGDKSLELTTDTSESRPESTTRPPSNTGSSPEGGAAVALPS